VCGELKPPQSVFEALQAKSVRAFFANHDFSWHIEGERWSCVVPGQYYRDLPLPPVLVQNAANAFMAAHCLKQQRPLSEVAMTDALRHVSILGRLQHVSLSGVDCVFDVAHNVASAAILRQHLGALEKPGRCVALVALQQSKDLTGIVSLMSDVIDEWHGICLPNPMPFYCCEALEAAVRCQAPSAAFYCVSDSALAFKQVRARLRPGDRLLVFGSFYLVGPLLQSLAKEHAHEITALA
jgi:dihydrofolate synthase/folylpolyglutamate synthase